MLAQHQEHRQPHHSQTCSISSSIEGPSPPSYGTYPNESFLFIYLWLQLQQLPAQNTPCAFSSFLVLILSCRMCSLSSILRLRPIVQILELHRVTLSLAHHAVCPFTVRQPQRSQRQQPGWPEQGSSYHLAYRSAYTQRGQQVSLTCPPLLFDITRCPNLPTTSRI